MSMKWTQQEDNLLKQLDALGYSSSKIYKEYGSILKNRSQNAIALRLSYLHKPPEERRKEDGRKTEGRHGQLRQRRHARKSNQPGCRPYLQQARQYCKRSNRSLQIYGKRYRERQQAR